MLKGMFWGRKGNKYYRLSSAEFVKGVEETNKSE